LASVLSHETITYHIFIGKINSINTSINMNLIGNLGEAAEGDDAGAGDDEADSDDDDLPDLEEA